MQNVVLVLLSVLILIVIAIVFVGYKKMSSLRVQISKLQLDVLSLRNFIDERILSSNPSMLGGFQPMMNVASSPINTLSNEEESNSTAQLTTEPVEEDDENSDSEYSYETVTDSEEEDDEETEAKDEDSEDEEKEDVDEEEADEEEADEEEEEEEEADEEEEENEEEEEADEEEDKTPEDENVDEEVDLEEHEHIMSDELANKMFTAVQYLAAAQSLMHQEPMNVNTSNMTKEVHFETTEQTVKVDTKPKRGRRVPNTKPNKLNVGYVQESENDGNTYVVIENKNGVKRWAKYTGPPIEEAVSAPDIDVDVVKLPTELNEDSVNNHESSSAPEVIILPETDEMLRGNSEDLVNEISVD